MKVFHTHACVSQAKAWCGMAKQGTLQRGGGATQRGIVFHLGSYYMRNSQKYKSYQKFPFVIPRVMPMWEWSYMSVRV